MKKSINKDVPIIDMECNAQRALHFNDFSVDNKDLGHGPVGHLVKLTIPSLNMVLNQDIAVGNPINPEIKNSITAVIEYIGWGLGIAEDSGWYGVVEKNDWDENAIRIQAQLSPENSGILRKTFNVLWSEASDKATLEIELVIYKYDAVNGYYKQFYTIKPLVLRSVDPIKFTKNSECGFDQRIISCILQASVIPQNDQVWVCI